ncbi:MAG TPA: cyclic di-AMP binding protein CbpA [Bacillota bacterium]|nr:cyclic di-AMP binding protein CbpA [Bacillota bacterium]
MLVKHEYVTKDKVVVVKETDSKEAALKRLTDSGYRCIPVLDEAGEKYVGNIYKVDLLREEIDDELDGTIARLIRDQEDGHIKEEAPFFNVFSTIKRLPFLAVVEDDQEFLGILTNANVISVLEQAWGAERGSYSYTIGTIEYAGALQQMLEIINEYCTVESVISLNNDLKFVRRVCIVLPKDVTEKTADQISEDLEANNFTVIHRETLNK